MVTATFLINGHLSLDRYFAFFDDGYTMANLRYTLEMGLVSALAALALSFGIALYLRFSAGRIATLIHGLSLFPLFVPSIIISYALVRFLGPNGLFQLLLEQVELVAEEMVDAIQHPKTEQQILAVAVVVLAMEED